MTVAQYKIKKYLKDHDMSQAQALKKLGYCNSGLTYIYKKSLPNVHNIKNYEDFFNIKNEVGSNITKANMVYQYGNLKNAWKWFQMQTGDNVHYETFLKWANGVGSPPRKRMKLYCELFDIRNEWVIDSVNMKPLDNLTTAQKKIKHKMGLNITQSYNSNIGIPLDTLRRMILGNVPIRRTQLKCNNYFDIVNDFMSGLAREKVPDIEKGHVNFVVATGKKITYSHFRHVIIGQSVSSLFMIDICKYFNLQNDYFI